MRNVLIRLIAIALTLLMVAVTVAVVRSWRMERVVVDTGVSVAYLDNNPKRLFWVQLHKNGRTYCVGKFSHPLWAPRLIGYERHSRRWICLGEEMPGAADGKRSGLIVSFGKSGQKYSHIEHLGDGDLYRGILVGDHVFIFHAGNGIPFLSEHDLEGHLLAKRTLDIDTRSPWLMTDLAISRNGATAVTLVRERAEQRESDVYVFDKAGKRMASLGVGRHVTFDSSGNQLLFISNSRLARIYNLRTKRLMDLYIGKPPFQFSSLSPTPITGLLSAKWGAMPNTYVAQYERMWPSDSSIYSVECKDGKAWHARYLSVNTSESWIVVPNTSFE